MLGRQYLAECQAALTAAGDCDAHRALAAAKLFWKASVLLDPWPPALHQRTTDMLRRLIDLGLVGAPSAPLTPKQAKQICADLLQLVHDFRKALPKSPGANGSAAAWTL